MRRKKILVTGASGFIGKALVAYLLEQGYEVRCLVRATSNTAPLEKLGVELAKGDLSDQASLHRAMLGVDAVYHLAGQIHTNANETFDQINAQGTDHVMQAAAAQTPKPVVLAVSSLAATGPRVSLSKPQEQDELSPVSKYGLSKVESEQALRAYADRLEISIVRPPMVLGAGDTTSLPLFKNIKMGIHPTIDKSQHFSFVYVKDLARLMVEIVERGERISTEDKGDGQGIYFSAFEESLLWTEIGEKMAVAMGKRKPINLPVPKAVITQVGTALDKLAALTNKTMPLSKDKAIEGVSGHWICSSAKAEQQFDFQPLHSIDETFDEIVKGYRQLGML